MAIDSRRLRRWLSNERLLAAILAVTAAGLVARLFALGHRVAQWDEGRVAYWTLRYEATGLWHYRPIVHGPFLFHVDARLFSLFGANDFTLRLIVAIVGALLPLAAWLFREHLRDSEAVALSLLLAFNPFLLYYSRFFRNDVLVATFLLLGLGLFVRAIDTSDHRYLYAAVVAVALGFTTKENALVYLLCWFGAGVLLLDHRFLRAVPAWRADADSAGARDEAAPTRPDGEGSPDAEGRGSDEASLSRFEGVGDLISHVGDRVVGIADRFDWRAALLVVAINPLVLSTILDPVVGLLPDSLVGSGSLATTPLWVAFFLAAAGLALVLAVPMANPTRVYLGGAAYYGVAIWLFLARPSGAVAVLWFWLTWAFGMALVADVVAFGREGRADARVPPIAASYLLFVGVLVFFYAPRGGATEAPGLWAVFGNPAGFPITVEEALAGSWESFMGTWGRGQHQRHAYMPYLIDYLERMSTGAIVTVVFAVVGFVADRYATDGPRDLVALGFYWGVATLLGYPVITDIKAPWGTVHAIVPLAIPAAVGLGLLYRWGRDAVTDRQTIQATLAVVIAVLIVGWTAGVAYDVNYPASDAERNRAFVHWTQPGNDLRWTLEQIERVSAANDDGPDVLFYGSRRPNNRDEKLFYVPNESDNLQPPAGSGWYDRLPLPWYLERYGASVTSTSPDARPHQALEDPPPVVIAFSWDADEVKPYLGGYVAYRHRFKLWGQDVVVFIHRSHLSPDDY